EEIYFLSSRELGKRFDMDAATIVRTIQVLGYDRYADFAADLRRHFVARITPYTTMQAATREKQSVADRLRQNVDKDIANLHLLKTGLDTTQVIAVAKRIHRARRVVVVGIDLAASLAHFLAYGLAVQGFDAEAPVGSAGNLIHKIKVLDSKDLVIAISFGRCLRETVEAAQRAREQGVPTFGITDSDTTPLAKYCDGYVVAAIASSVFTGSYVAPMAAINTIIAACAHLHPQRTLALLRDYEKEAAAGARWHVGGGGSRMEDRG
ncbi:MAG TPA: MurR/RpiR family transcriptional regulator, partial [Blastocatellia bacterium]|nr:MurR/RpiR family transcriptional regulator [Blastocatellia bacterium]